MAVAHLKIVFTVSVGKMKMVTMRKCQKIRNTPPKAEYKLYQ